MGRKAERAVTPIKLEFSASVTMHGHTILKFIAYSSCFHLHMSPFPNLLKSSKVSVTTVSNTEPAFLKWRIGRSAVFPAFQGLYGQNSLADYPCGLEEQIPNEKYPRKKKKKSDEEEEDKRSQLAFVVDPKLPRSLRTRRGRYCPLTGLLFDFWDVTVKPRFISRLSDAV